MLKQSWLQHIPLKPTQGRACFLKLSCLGDAMFQSGSGDEEMVWVLLWKTIHALSLSAWIWRLNILPFKAAGEREVWAGLFRLIDKHWKAKSVDGKAFVELYVTGTAKLSTR